MVQLGLRADFKRQVLQWDSATVHIKEPSNFIEEFDLTKREISEVVIQTEGSSSIREATEWMVKIFDSAYVKLDLKKVADNASQMNYGERNLLLSLLKDFEELCDGTLGERAANPVDLELNPYSKPFNSR